MKKSLLPTIGIIIYIILSVIDKFILKIANYVYIPVGFLSLILIIVGLIKDRKSQKNRK